MIQRSETGDPLRWLTTQNEDESRFKEFIKEMVGRAPNLQVPVVLWSRLYFDLEPYLTERSADGASLLSFYHRQLRQTYGEKWDELHATLTDSDFLEAKCTHVAVITSGKEDNAKTIYGGVYELQQDYWRALEEFPTV